MSYLIEVREVLSIVKEVDADSAEEAICKIEKDYKNQEIVLCADNFTSVEYIDVT